MDFSIVDSHVHLCDPSRLGYSWMNNAPQLKRVVLPEHLTEAAAPVRIDQFVFVEVDVDAMPGAALRSRSHRQAANQGGGPRGPMET
jgi:predicted TIM-barrel fold metal-dependent hydrolase